MGEHAMAIINFDDFVFEGELRIEVEPVSPRKLREIFTTPEPVEWVNPVDGIDFGSLIDLITQIYVQEDPYMSETPFDRYSDDAETVISTVGVFLSRMGVPIVRGPKATGGAPHDSYGCYHFEERKVWLNSHTVEPIAVYTSIHEAAHAIHHTIEPMYFPYTLPFGFDKASAHVEYVADCVTVSILDAIDMMTRECAHLSREHLNVYRSRMGVDDMWHSHAVVDGIIERMCGNGPFPMPKEVVR